MLTRTTAAIRNMEIPTVRMALRTTAAIHSMEVITADTVLRTTAGFMAVSRRSELPLAAVTAMATTITGTVNRPDSLITELLRKSDRKCDRQRQR